MVATNLKYIMMIIISIKKSLQIKSVVVQYMMFRRGGECVGFFVISKCGHDAGDVYIIVSAAGDFVYVANGKNRTIQNPKKKNPTHLDITKIQVPFFARLLELEPVSANLKLAKHIKEFRRVNE